MTRSEQIEIYGKCLYDPIYTIEKFFMTFDLTQKGNVPFRLFHKQKEIIHTYENNNRIIVTKPRQAGVSTTTAAYIASKIAFGDPKNPWKVLILANKQTLAQEFLQKIRDFLDQVPNWVWGIDDGSTYLTTDSKGHIKIKSTKCEVKALATSKDALRGYTPTFLIMDEAAFIDNGSEVFGAALTSLGCITKDSLILTDNGLVELDDLVKEKDKIGFTDLDTPYKVCNRYGEIEDSTQTFVSEYGETFKIKNDVGMELEGSWKHPLLVKRDDKEVWVRMNELQVGDKLIIGYDQNKFGSNDIIEWDYINKYSKTVNIPKNLKENLNFVYLLGLFLAEGNFSVNSVQITNGDNSIENFLINDKCNLGSPFKKFREYHFNFCSIELNEWLIDFGFKKVKAGGKELPKKLFSCSKEVISTFLQGLFDGDGCSTKKEIKYSSSSKKLTKQIQILLLNYGIKSHIRVNSFKPGKNSVCINKDKITTMYDLFIYSDYALKFYDEIGFRLERKQKNKQFLLNKSRNSRYVNIEKNVVKELIKKYEIRSVKVKFLDRFWKSKYNRISYESIYKLINLIGENDPVIQYFLSEIENNKKYFLSEVIEITKSENHTYDLHVPMTNSFISNGFISHNTGGKISLISTPNGLDELYYKTYDGAKTGKNNFKIVEMRWHQDIRYNRNLRWLRGDDEEIKCENVGRSKLRWEYNGVIYETSETSIENYDIMIKDGWKPSSFWYESMCEDMNGDVRQIAQELDVSFVGSGGNVIDEKYIEYQSQNNVIDPEFTAELEKKMWVWKKPEIGHKYLMGVDVARGDGKDSSTIIILDFENLEQVAEYQGMIPPDFLAQLVYKYGNMYSAYTIIDITGGMGVSTVVKLQELGYKYLHLDNSKTKILQDKRSIDKYVNVDNKTPGFNVGSNRLHMITELEEHVRENKTIIRSTRLISELKTFVYKNGRPDHMEGYHDDLIMALAMCIFIVQTSFKNLEKVTQQTKAMLESWVTTSNSVPTTKIYNDNNTQFYTNTNNNNQQNIPINNDPNQDFSWLFGFKK
jgi:intein/homing endonuclease